MGYIIRNTIVILFLFPLAGITQNQKVFEGYSYAIDSSGKRSDTVLVSRKWINENGTTIKEENYWSDRRGRHKRQSFYDLKGQLVKKVVSLMDSTFVTITEFKRDARNSIVQQLFSGTDGESIFINANIYKKKGKLITSISSPQQLPAGVQAKDFTTKTAFRYNTKNNLVEMVQSIAGKMVSITTYTYDSSNNKTSETTLGKDGVDTKLLYQYDSANRLVNQKTFLNGSLTTDSFFTWNDDLITEQRDYYSKEKKTVITYFKFMN